MSERPTGIATARRRTAFAVLAFMLFMSVSAADAQTGKKIKIGILAPYSGVFALFGRR